MFKKTCFFLGASYFLITKKTQCSPQPPLSMILRGEYENKIRRLSPPEKIFQVFGTKYRKGKLYMTTIDLLKAICFYSYSVLNQESVLDFKPPNITRFLGKDDDYEIYDYFILARFLVMDKFKLKEYVWNKYGQSQIDKKAFRDYLQKEICSDYLNYIKTNILWQTRHIKPSYQQFEKKLDIIAENCYKTRRSLTLEQIDRIRRRMLKQLFQFQFKMFPSVDNDKIDGTDFARSVIKYVEPSQTKKYTKRIKKMKELEDVRVDFKAYKAFHIYMQSNLRQIEEFLNKKGAISSNQLVDLINTYICRKGTVTREQIQVIVKVLDYDDSGFLQKKQVLGVLKNIQYYTSVKSGQNTLIENLKKDFVKFTTKFSKILEIIDEQ